MILGVNENNEIMQVGNITDLSLTVITYEGNFFQDKDTPLDFRIIVEDNTTTIYPKWDYEIKQVIRRENGQRIADIEQALATILGGAV